MKRAGTIFFWSCGVVGVTSFIVIIACAFLALVGKNQVQTKNSPPPISVDLETAAKQAAEEWRKLPEGGTPGEKEVDLITSFLAQDPCRAVEVLKLTKGQLRDLGYSEGRVPCVPPLTEDNPGIGVYLTR